MECVDISIIIMYLIIGAAYASVKHYALWDYHKHRSGWMRWHHYWTEACFWPIDFVISAIKLFMHNSKQG